MKVQFKKNVRLICDLNVGDIVRTDGWGYKLDDMDWIVENVEYSDKCESSFLVKINGYDRPIDSSWLIKQPPMQQQNQQNNNP